MLSRRKLFQTAAVATSAVILDRVVASERNIQVPTRGVEGHQTDFPEFKVDHTKRTVYVSKQNMTGRGYRRMQSLADALGESTGNQYCLNVSCSKIDLTTPALG